MTTMDHSRTHALPHSRAAIAPLLPIMAAVLIGFLVIGVALPVLPLHVHDTLGQSAFIVGLVAGAQFGIAILSRPWAGRYADSTGPKSAMTSGLVVSSGAGLLYLLSLCFPATPTLAVAILLVGRALLGAGESFIITGAQAWGLSLLGPAHTGRVLAWMGTAMYAAFALGAPLGEFLHLRYGFAVIALATALGPLATLLFVGPLTKVLPTHRAHSGIRRVLAAVWLPGLGSALSSVGFGAMIAFVSVLFSARGWTVWPAFSAFAVAFIAARLLLGHLADGPRNAKVALVFVLIEAAGQALIWTSGSAGVALAGSALTGFGYSLVYPAFGVEAVRRARAPDRGLAMGAYTAFLDLALGLAGPGLGLAASAAGLGSVFLVSALCALASALLAAKFIITQGAAT